VVAVIKQRHESGESKIIEMNQYNKVVEIEVLRMHCPRGGFAVAHLASDVKET
jgi:hypothetical protein